MKKFFFSVMILALAATACQKETATVQSGYGDGPVFTATIADDCCTRTTLKGMTPVWNVGDEASINGYIYCAIPLADNTRKATFVAKYPKSGFPFAPYVAWYPASIYDARTKTTTLPSVQKYGDFSINPMVAVSGNPELSFKNVCAVLAIKVKSRDIELIKSIRVSSANCATSGEFTIKKTAEGYKAVLKDPEDVKQTVVLDCGEGVEPTEEGTVFHVAIPAQVYKSLKIEISEDGEVYTKEMTTKGEEGREVFENKIYDITFKADSKALLPGKFTINAAGQQVQFSRGNLQAKYSTSTSSYNWGFAANQWDYIGNAAGNTGIDSQTDGAVVDLFGWVGASSTKLTGDFTKYGISTSTTSSDYGTLMSDALYADWANISTLPQVSGREWKTLTGGNSGEWYYLLNTRLGVTIESTTGCRYAEVKVNSICGMLIFPDTFTWPSDVSSKPSIFNTYQSDWNNVNYTVEQFSSLQNAGCVFLPAAGGRNGSSLLDVGSCGNYWSSTPDSSYTNRAYYLGFYRSGVSPSYSNIRKYGFSVRLVSAAQ